MVDTDRELVIHDDPIMNNGDVWRSRLLDLRDADASLAEIILPYKETSKGKASRRVKKKDEEMSCMVASSLQEISN